MPDVRMPDGTIIRNVPEGTTRAELERKYGAHTAKTAKVERPTVGSSLLDSAKNLGARMLEGAAAIPDAVNEATHAIGKGAVLGGVTVADPVLRGLGAGRAADAVKGFGERVENDRPLTIGGLTQQYIPQTPGHGVTDFATQMLGGAMIPFAPKVTPRISAPRAVAAPRGVAAMVTEQTPRQARRLAGQAAERQGITMMPADVGGTGVRMASGIVRRTLGEIPMAEGARKAVKSASDSVGRAATRIGMVGDEAGAGQAAQRGAKAFIRDSERRADELYEVISIPPEKLAEAGNTRGALAEIIKGFDSNPELSKIWTGHPQLKATLDAITQPIGPSAGEATLAIAKRDLNAAQAGYRAGKATAGFDMIGGRAKILAARQAIRDAEKVMLGEVARPKGTVSWQDMKRLRSIVGQIIGQPSLASDGATNAAMRKFYGALSQDMEATATAAGPRALTEFRRANQYFRGRADRIENVLSGILGPNMNKGDEAAFQQINNWAAQNTGNSNKLARAIRSMPEDEAGTVRASIVARMGRASPGRQNADGLEFSPAEFATQWNKMSPRAKSILFPSVKHRGDLNDIAVAMDGMKRAGQYANTSNTSLGTNAMAHLAGTIAAPFLTAFIAGGEFSAGVLLSSPRVARYLARMPAEASPGAIKSTIAGLGALAKQEPGRVAAEINILQQHMARTFANDNVGVAAAAGDSPENQDKQQPALQP